jgi:ABC-type branched-subunit amino acid transport system ATPase component
VTGLELHEVRKAFGGLIAVESVSLRVARGEIVALIGPNGSGKTTLLNLISGYHEPDAGSIRLDGRLILGSRPDRIARLGIARTFQLTRIFPELAVVDNLIVAGCARGLTRAMAETRAAFLLEELTLSRVGNSVARQLSGGQQKLLEFGSCYMVPAPITLLDEPFAGVHPNIKEVMIKCIRDRRAGGHTTVIVSHDMPVVAELCPRTICMGAGQIVADGLTPIVLADSRVIESYLGGESR